MCIRDRYFALSDDAWNWTMASKECVHSKDRYTACPVIRYLPEDDYYYMIYLEQIPAWGFVPYIARSHNLKEWELSPVNPVIMFDDAEDKKIANFNLTREQQKRIEEALDVNNSDEMCIRDRASTAVATDDKAFRAVSAPAILFCNSWSV